MTAANAQYKRYATDRVQLALLAMRRAETQADLDRAFTAMVQDIQSAYNDAFPSVEPAHGAGADVDAPAVVLIGAYQYP